MFFLSLKILKLNHTIHSSYIAQTLARIIDVKDSYKCYKSKAIYKTNSKNGIGKRYCKASIVCFIDAAQYTYHEDRDF
jgi:hypothetical protein